MRFNELCIALVVGSVGMIARSSPAARPNVILCMADDQGWEEVAYNGHPALKTPVLDEMARTGFRFDRFYSASSNCGPTRGSIMTGRRCLSRCHVSTDSAAAQLASVDRTELYRR